MISSAFDMRHDVLAAPRYTGDMLQPIAPPATLAALLNVFRITVLFDSRCT